MIAWVLYSAHFATNVVREHYPAFSLADRGTLQLDEYQGLHSDIFVHRDGHSFINNQVFVSALAAIPLVVFDPVLDALEDYRTARLADGPADAEYRTDKPMRREFFRLVRERGLDLRFGAAAVITVVFFMAPLTALFLVGFYQVLRSRTVSRSDAAFLTFLLGFGTPLVFRATVLSHNMFVMYGMFAAFALLWVRPGLPHPVSRRRRVLAGLCAGMTVATDYVGVVVMPLLFAYLVVPRLATASWRTALRESLAMIAGSLPPVLFLWYTQWAMFGNPFLPAQHWMPDQNVYAITGARGFTWPDGELLLQNLLHPGFGLFVWAPLVSLALVPTRWYRPESLILPRRERWFVVVASAALLIFCSMNQYARLQWNSGFRYLLPLVPFLLLALADHWVRLPTRVRLPIASLAVLHAWVLTVFREQAPKSWELFATEGIQLPWFRVLRMTSTPDSLWTSASWLPAVLLAGTVTVCGLVWRYGRTLETLEGPPASMPDSERVGQTSLL